MDLLLFLSNIATIGFVLPLLVLELAILIALRRLDLVCRWAAAIGIAILVTLALKKAAIWGATAFPSGHVSLAVAFYGGWLVAMSGPPIWLPLAGGLAIGTAIGVARLFLHIHTDWDVLGGLVTGLCALLAAWATWPSRRQPLPRRERLILIIAMIVGGIVVYSFAMDELDTLIRSAVPI